MACDSCVLSFYGGNHLLALKQLELGPAYEDYVRGAVNIPRVFHDRRRVPNFLVPWCCAEKPFNITTSYPRVYLSLLAVWWTVSLLLFPLYWPKRHSYPLSFRSPPTFLTLWLALGIGNALSSVNAAAGLSCTCHLFLIAMQIILPVQMYYLTYKSVQLYFAYWWNFAKRMNMRQKVASYGKYKWIMTDKPFLVGATALLLLGICIHMMEMTSLRSMHNPSLNQIYSLRTFWWQIPPKYQKPTTLDGKRGRMCVCWDLALIKWGDTSVAARNTTVQELTARCTSSYLSYCLSNPTCASACPFNDVTSPKCADWFRQYYSTGVCGYPEEFANMSTSRVCFGVNRAVFYLYMAIYQLFLVTNFILMCFISRLDDQLCMRFELVMASLVGVPSVNVLFLAYVSPDVKDFFLRLLPSVYLEVVVSYFVNFVGLLLNIAFPIALAYKQDFNKSCDSSITEVSRQERDSSIFYTDKVDHPLTGELMFALSNQTAAEIYLNFAWREFTVENFMFLQAVKMLMDRFNANENSTEIALESWKLYRTFIESTAPMELNIPGQMRNSIVRFLMTNANASEYQELSGFTSQGDISVRRERDAFSAGVSIELKDHDMERNDAVDVSLKSKLQACLQPMVQEIKILILRDSWPRFRASVSYPQFAELLKQHKTFDDAVRRLHKPPIAPSLALSRETFHHQRHSISTSA